MTRRVVITGGGSGIGLTIARRYLDEGAQVAICDNDPDLVKTVSKYYKVAISFCADVSDSNQMVAFHRDLLQPDTVLPYAILINNHQTPLNCISLRPCL